MRKLFILAVFAFLAVSLIIFFYQININTSGVNAETASYYLTHNAEDFNIPNVVTSIVTQYRGYDTIGEITVLFLAIIGVYMLVTASGLKSIDKLLNKPGYIVNIASTILFPLIMLIGAYIIVNGHLSPGGGFQGGAVIGSGMILMMLSGNIKELNKTATHITESLSVTIIMLIGLLGIYYFNAFLANIIGDMGIFGNILSGGIIPIIYALIGIKVAVEFFHLSEYLLRS